MDELFEDRLGKMLSELAEEHRVPGAVVGVLHEGERTFAAAGVTSIEHPLEVTADTLFQIGSITKTMTATVMMRLAEEGLLDLDAPVRHYLPDFRVADDDAAAQVRVRDLLSHSAGWVGDLFTDTGMGDDAFARYLARMADLPQLAPIGTHYSYNNAAFCITGPIVETVTGRRYEAVMEAWLFKPLGLSQSLFDPGDVMVRRFAVGHEERDGELQVATPWPLPRYVYPAGGVTSTAGDLLTYAQLYLDGGRAPSGERLLSEEAIARLWTPRLRSSREEEVCLGWFTREIDGARIYRHGGGTKGQQSHLLLLPERDFALVSLTNSNKGGSLIVDLLERVLQEAFGLEREKPEPVEATAEQLAEVAGVYRRPLFALAVSVEGDHLRLEGQYLQSFPTEEAPLPPPLPPMAASFTAEGDLLVLDGPLKDDVIELIRKEDGAIGWLRAGGRLHPRVG